MVQRRLAVLIVCPLGLATLLFVMTARGKAAESGLTVSPDRFEIAGRHEGRQLLW